MASVWPAHDRMDFRECNYEMRAYYATEEADGQRRSGRVRWRTRRLEETMNLLVEAIYPRRHGGYVAKWDRLTYGPWAEQAWAATQGERTGPYPF